MSNYLDQLREEVRLKQLGVEVKNIQPLFELINPQEVLAEIRIRKSSAVESVLANFTSATHNHSN